MYKSTGQPASGFWNREEASLLLGDRIQRHTKKGVELLFRPFEAADEQLLKDFFQGLSAESLRRRFLSPRREILNEYLGIPAAFGPCERIVILGVIQYGAREVEVQGGAAGEKVVAVGEYYLCPDTTLAEVALVVDDGYQNLGIGRELFLHLARLAERRGMRGFTGITLIDNRPMLHLCETMGFASLEKRFKPGVYELEMTFAS